MLQFEFEMNCVVAFILLAVDGRLVWSMQIGLIDNRGGWDLLSDVPGEETLSWIRHSHRLHNATALYIQPVKNGEEFPEALNEGFF